MSIEPISFHIPNAEDCEVSWEVDSGVSGDMIARSSVWRDYTIRFRAHPDEDDITLYKYSGDAATCMRTVESVGDLTLAMIGTARVRTEYEGATIEGLVTGLDLDIETHHFVAFGGLERDPLRDQTSVTVDLSLGNISLQGLRRSHPCEVVS